MSKTAITSPELAPPAGPFSQAVKIDGFLFFSGQVVNELADQACERIRGNGT
jgi:enamine deaminase RidA (YjgF/YER057c/UK114 family)